MHFLTVPVSFGYSPSNAYVSDTLARDFTRSERCTISGLVLAWTNQANTALWYDCSRTVGHDSQLWACKVTTGR